MSNVGFARLRTVESFARRMRLNVFEMALNAGAGRSHIGGGLSIVDICAVLYGDIMTHDPLHPQDDGRDRFILSKGHGVLGYYTALAEIGFLSKEELMKFETSDSFLFGHPVMNRGKGIEFSNGSLGMGLGIGIGVALAGRLKQKEYRTYVLIGDGECNEGSVWEAALSAPKFGLDTLYAIIDRNNLQQTGSGDEILPLGDLAKKWREFGWNTIEVDGHNYEELIEAFDRPPQENHPTAIIANTIKGKGLRVAEDNNDYHHNVLTKKVYEEAISSLTDADT